MIDWSEILQFLLIQSRHTFSSRGGSSLKSSRSTSTHHLEVRTEREREGGTCESLGKQSGGGTVAAAPSQSPPLLQEEALRFLFALPSGHINRHDASRERKRGRRLGRQHPPWRGKALAAGQWMAWTRRDPGATSGIRPRRRGRGRDRARGGGGDRGAAGIRQAEEIGVRRL